jgi:E3 ubiquitin-protein ligase SHPRH
MIEPLLNCGLDSQAIARVNRIGQTSKTYVHRYLIEGTIEVKIDNIRVEREEDQLEDSISETKKEHDISAGGIDGGFTEAELQDILK